MTLVAFLEELSAATLLRALLPPLLPAGWNLRCIPFEGKQDLEKSLERKMRGWLAPGTRFLVMRDRDSEDCREVKKGSPPFAEKPDVLKRLYVLRAVNLRVSTLATWIPCQGSTVSRRHRQDRPNTVIPTP